MFRSSYKMTHMKQPTRDYISKGEEESIWRPCCEGLGSRDAAQPERLVSRQQKKDQAFQLKLDTN